MPVSAPGMPASVFDRIVVGIDFSPASLSAARWATTHVARDAEAIVSHVVPPPRGSWEQDEFDVAELRALRQTTPAIHGGLGGFAATLDVARARTVVRIGRASHWLSTLVAGAHASLLILGRRADSNRRGLGEPNVLERSARRALASVLVVPEGTKEPPRHIIAAIDRSDAAERVLAVAQSLATIHSCPLVVLHVVAPTTGSYDRVMQSARGREPKRAAPALHHGREKLGEHAEAWLAELVSARRLTNAHRLVVAVGEPAREIAASRVEAPLIVVGKRGQDAAPPGSVGSVTRELLTRAGFPVLAVADEGRAGGRSRRVRRGGWG